MLTWHSPSFIAFFELTFFPYLYATFTREPTNPTDKPCPVSPSVPLHCISVIRDSKHVRCVWGLSSMFNMPRYPSWRLLRSPSWARGRRKWYAWYGFWADRYKPARVPGQIDKRIGRDNLYPAICHQEYVCGRCVINFFSRDSALTLLKVINQHIIRKSRPLRLT